MTRLVTLALAAALSTACVGQIVEPPERAFAEAESDPESESESEAEAEAEAEPEADPESDPGDDPEPGGPTLSPLEDLVRSDDPESPPTMRLLTREELATTLQLLVGFVPAALETRPKDPTHYYFPVVSQSQTIDQAFVDAYESVAHDVAAAMLADWSLITQHAPSCESADAQCAQAFVDSFTPLAFRRPLAPAERARLLGLYEAAPTPEDGLAQIVRATLMSPSFLYLVAEDDTLTPFEVAARMSFALCQQPPDAQLWLAAESGEILEPEVRAEHAARLLAGPCGPRVVRTFFRQWIGSEEVYGLELPAEVFPELDQALAAALIEETEAFAEHAVLTEGEPLAGLLTADYTVLDDTLADFYGLEGLASSAAPVELPPERRGLLTHASVLATYGRPHGRSMIHRGLFVMRRLLCQEIPPPPPAIQMNPPIDLSGATPREVSEDRMANPQCGGCHGVMDPIGLSFEQFDQLGRLSTAYPDGQAATNEGGLPLHGVALGELEGPAQLAELLAETNQIHACMSRQWFRYVFGRLEGEADEGALLSVSSVSASGESLSAALLHVFSLPEFVTR